jgi:drug/metabolite transporter (DMT)-like permease
MISPHLLGSLSGLLASAFWGSGDFAGGMASRKQSPFQVLALAALTGTVFQLALALAWGDPIPALPDALWAAAAGASGSVGIAVLYRGLSMGNAAIIAPTAGVVGAIIPVAFELARRNPPTPLQFLGFAAALLGIWLVNQTRSEGSLSQRRGFWMALGAGLLFGCFFILLGRVDTEGLFAPLVLMRCAAFGIAALFLLFRRERLPALMSNPKALLAGLLDAGGNVFYLLAIRNTRLDAATVLSSLYPAATVILASTLTHEAISGRQWMGVLICLAAVILIVV